MRQEESFDPRKKFQTSLVDKMGRPIKEGDFILISTTKKMNNHYWDGYDGLVNRGPYKEWDAVGGVVYLVEWDGATLVANRLKEYGNPHPSLSTGFHYLNSCFKSKEYVILGNIHDGFSLKAIG